MNFYKALQEIDKNKKNIVVTIISGENIGDKILLSEGKIVFSNSNTVDWDNIISFIPTNNKSQVLTINGNKVYFEFIRQSYNVVVCGAGHISMAIIKMCKILDLNVTVIDDRLNFANDAIRAGANNVICEPFEKALDNIYGDNGTFFIIVTRGHRYDQTCLEKIINKENAYIGMIGSKVRVRKVLDYLEEKGIQQVKLNNIYTPIGLKIGAETPAEIAVAIMAEIIEVKNKEIGSSTYSDELLTALFSENYYNIPKAIVTIVSRKGSAPREIGTKMAVLKDGTMIGTIGGGCVESSIRQSAFSCIDNQKCKLIQVDMTGREAEDEGMVCGGIVEIFIDQIKCI
ncbi:xanthine dehydrogenase accessory factor [Sedimentibacter acidaminivorans]|uniref:Xanthine dehydrogenase accessory factor n=1 Tax=Sedimentibacter acidaminivorans TaxID=913099 RepID=A0ABS4GIA8_9FIRM|nr:XdhC/CoxI family protein [Sedimentibacter acidaminivorans]MBP1927428.1 xanthine dehydrogenase accessory factor [Sedimentibacter acidaminivorans]